MFSINWVNHASFVFDDGEIKLITDPWIEGSVFNDSWSLLAKTKFKYEDFNNIDYIWFSHEHPDHFFPPNLKKIPKEMRKNISILFHKTKDQKVVKFCKHLGFKEVIEIDSKYYQLSKHSKLYVEKFDEYSLDSWFYIESFGKGILNVNDCVLNSKNLIDKLKCKIGSVDYLLTQFSYANWVGNPEDKEKRMEHAREKFNRIHNQIEVFKPKFLIPFASFVYFSHKDNFFLNETINTIEDTYKEFSSEIETLVFYPGDKYVSGSKWEKNKENIEKYNFDFMNIDKNNLKTFDSQNIDEIREKLIKGPFGTFDLKGLGAGLLVKSIGIKKVIIKLHDINELVEFDLINKTLKEVKGQFDIEMSSQSLSYMLGYLWGPSTILIAGTFFNANANGIRFMNFLSEISQCISNEKKFDFYFSLGRFIDIANKKVHRIIEKSL